MSRTVFICVNGILTDPGDAYGWTDRAEEWINAQGCEVRADSFEYFSGALTRRLHQAKRVAIVLDKVRFWQWHGFAIRLVGHSNGADIICRLLSVALERAITIDAAYLIAAAADRELSRYHIPLYAAAHPDFRLHCLCSANDRALQLARRTQWLRVLGLGYGTLGLEGPAIDGVSFSGGKGDWLRCKWENSFDHSTWFDPAHFEDTMRLITGEVLS